ncbi:probable myosin-binding protein 5 isoform X2 [Eutrema salsugineum]|uniref:probable myosin-binding protein 5 isoform X2 n=1 Tax=Eutrema salsugineum TaxID=72664 RepID=UPI000CED44CE|nr:probable myosin-binding protein 5 isoform X2 [Eutrema salsugineum]
MRCQEVRSWTFTGLVAAFVDLSVAFSLLCASCLVYLSSKLLSLFGLNLPCPCDGLFSDPHKNKCLQESLRNLPVKKILNVQRSVKKRTPFDSVLNEEANGGECVGKKRKGGCRHVELDREVENASGFDLLTSQSLKKGSFKVKSKRLSFHRSPYGLKNHCQSSLKNKDADENDPLLVNSKGRKALEDVSLRKSISLSSIGCDEAGDQNKQPGWTFSWAGEGTCISPVDLTRKPIEILEQVLAEERVARAGLALELEKERSAAATAADEALGMILRLQEEKASIEMEARQYHRMIEEKSAFDAEEMSILKEILLRREREKHFLEKEVDTYRQMFLETKQPLPNTPDSKPLDDMETAGFEIFANQMDSRILALGDYEVDQSSSRNYGLLVDAEPKERECGTSFLESVSRTSNISDSKKLREDSCYVHDIHVVTNEDNKVQLNVSSNHVTRDLKLDRSQSVSDTPACPQGQRNICPTMRRNSMSAIDYERLRIESEVGLLRGRLRALQKGRENLSFSSKEQSKSQGDKTSRFWDGRRSGPLDSSSPSSTMVKAISMTLDLHSA